MHSKLQLALLSKPQALDLAASKTFHELSKQLQAEERSLGLALLHWQDLATILSLLILLDLKVVQVFVLASSLHPLLPFVWLLLPLFSFRHRRFLSVFAKALPVRL